MFLWPCYVYVVKIHKDRAWTKHLILCWTLNRNYMDSSFGFNKSQLNIVVQNTSNLQKNFPITSNAKQSEMEQMRLR